MRSQCSLLISQVSLVGLVRSGGEGIEISSGAPSDISEGSHSGP